MAAKPNRKINPIFASILLHALLLACLMVFVYFSEPSAPNDEPIQVETVKESRSPKRSNQHLSRSSVNGHARQAPHSHSVSLSDLGMRLDERSYQHESNPDEATPASETEGDGGWDMLNPDPRVARFNQYVYNTVQGWLDRDAYQNNQSIYGSVKVKLWFSATGEWLEDESVYDAADPEFRRIVIRALRKSFANPIPRPFLFKHEKFFIERMVVIRH